MIKNKRIFLTGGAGFIGTKLCELLEKNNNILIYDNLYRNSIKDTNLLNKDNIKLINGDVLDLDKLKKTIEEFNPQIIIHLAAVAGIDTVIKSPIKTMEVNLIGTYNLLKSLEKNISSVERFVDFSTSEVFGSYAYKVDEKNTTNLSAVGEARWVYQVSKIAGEHLVHSYYKEKRLPIVSIRPFNIYGPGQIGEGAIHKFVVGAINNQDIEIHGDGDQIRSWCYIEDFIQGILLVLEKEEAIGHSFNIGNPKGTITINHLAELIILLSNSKSKLKYIPKNYVDVELRIPSIEKSKQLLGFFPKVDLKEGLLKTIEWYRKKR